MFFSEGKHAIPLTGLGDIVVHKLAVITQSLGGAGTALGIYIGNNHSGAFGEKALGNAIANTGGATCNYGAFTCKFFI